METRGPVEHIAPGGNEEGLGTPSGNAFGPLALSTALTMDPGLYLGGTPPPSRGQFRPEPPPSGNTDPPRGQEDEAHTDGGAGRH